MPPRIQLEQIGMHALGQATQRLTLVLARSYEDGHGPVVRRQVGRAVPLHGLLKAQMNSVQAARHLAQHMVEQCDHLRFELVQ